LTVARDLRYVGLSTTTEEPEMTSIKIAFNGRSRTMQRAIKLAEVNGWSLATSNTYQSNSLIFTGEGVTFAWVNGYINN
jgi:hypothetical protein